VKCHLENAVHHDDYDAWNGTNNNIARAFGTNIYSEDQVAQMTKLINKANLSDA